MFLAAFFRLPIIKQDYVLMYIFVYFSCIVNFVCSNDLEKFRFVVKIFRSFQIYDQLVEIINDICIQLYPYAQLFYVDYGLHIRVMAHSEYAGLHLNTYLCLLDTIFATFWDYPVPIMTKIFCLFSKYESSFFWETKNQLFFTDVC